MNQYQRIVLKQIKMKTVAFKKKSRNVFFHILTKCNLSCLHCYINPKQHGTNTLSIDTISLWLKQLYKDNTNLILLGGEPTLRPDLSDIISIAKEIGYFSITVDTNGYLFNDFLTRVSRHELDFISFSLDGSTPDLNDFFRGNKSFEKCISGIKSAVSKGFKTSLIYTVSKKNIHDLHNIPDLIKTLGINRFFIQVIGIRGKSAMQNRFTLQLSMEQWKDTVPEVAMKIAKMGITVTYPRVYLNLDEDFECSGNTSDNYFVFPNGRVYRCPLCEDYPINSLEFKNNILVNTPKINENDLFSLKIPEGCVMNRLVQPGNIEYGQDGLPEYKIACCLLKEEIEAI